jgi:hypothetical protein
VDQVARAEMRLSMAKARSSPTAHNPNDSHVT